MTGAASFPLPAPAGGRCDLLVVAGEHSGDAHAARLVAGLRARRPEVTVAALGGPRLAAAGAQLLFDRTRLSVVGLAEVVKNVSFFRQLIHEVVRWVAAYRPRTVCLVDNSGVNLRIAEALRRRGLSTKGGGPVRTLYFISPQIWASRADRRFEMARNLDALAVIFPFEPGWYADTGLPVTFVGHPFLAPDYVAPVRLDPAGPVLLLPGSRARAVGLILPALLGGYREYARRAPGRRAVILYPSDPIAAQIRALGLPPEVTLAPAATASVGASAVLTSSGTMSMQCALAGIPGAIAYRTDPFTYVVGRWIVSVPYLGIANIILGEPMYPEYIQGAATPAALAAEMRAGLEDPARRERTARQARELRALMAQPAGHAPAEWLAAHLA
jgi:lipid-A-disaccharide synthase